MRQTLWGGLVIFVAFVGCSEGVDDGDPNAEPRDDTTEALGTDPFAFRNGAGVATSISKTGKIDQTNPFFQDLGTNGRRCVTCHQPAENWTITPEGVRARFQSSGGTDPIFRRNDGSNS